MRPWMRAARASGQVMLGQVDKDNGTVFNRMRVEVIWAGFGSDSKVGTKPRFSQLGLRCAEPREALNRLKQFHITGVEVRLTGLIRMAGWRTGGPR